MLAEVFRFEVGYKLRQPSTWVYALVLFGIPFLLMHAINGSSQYLNAPQMIANASAILGGIGMLYVVYLLWQHKDTAAGTASGTLLFTLTPWIVVGLFVLGAVLATYFKLRDPRRYELIGRIVYEDSEIRD